MAESTCAWSVFDGVKGFSAAAAPNIEALMAEIDSAIVAREYAHATTLLRPFSSPSLLKKSTPQNELQQEEERPAEVAEAAASESITPQEAVALADEAYKAACASLAAGKPDAALRSLRAALVNCPPEKASAVSKIKSLIAYASTQQKYLHNHHKSPTS